MTKYAVIGCGKVGAAFVACMRANGHAVVVSDKDRQRSLALERGEAPWCAAEPGVVVCLQGVAGSVMAGDGELMASCAAAFVCVDTPSRDDGRFDASGVHRALDSVPRGVQRVVVSTVSPGLRLGADVAYAPQMVALGRVMLDLRNPTYRVVGADTDEAWHAAVRALDDALLNRALMYVPTPRLTVLEAQWAKLTVNGFLAMKTAYANAVAHSAWAAGADAGKVLGAVALDPRIGGDRLSPGGPAGGPCLPRDVRAMMNADGRMIPLMSGVARTDDHTVSDVVAAVYRLGVASSKLRIAVGVIGTTYKLGVPHEFDSLGCRVVTAIRSLGRWPVRSWDPVLGGDLGALEADVTVACLPNLDHRCHIDPFTGRGLFT